MYNFLDNHPIAFYLISAGFMVIPFSLGIALWLRLLHAVKRLGGIFWITWVVLMIVDAACIIWLGDSHAFVVGIILPLIAGFTLPFLIAIATIILSLMLAGLTAPLATPIALLVVAIVLWVCRDNIRAILRKG